MRLPISENAINAMAPAMLDSREPLLLPYGTHGHKLHVFTPPLSPRPAAQTSAILFFFGGAFIARPRRAGRGQRRLSPASVLPHFHPFSGGWRGGNPQQFIPHCKHPASRGMICAAAEYRTNAVIRECIDDAAAAVTTLRQHSAALRFDPERLVVSGGSAGGHLAIALCVCPVNDEINAARPNSCVVFNPNVTIVGLQRWAELTGFSPPDGN